MYRLMKSEKYTVDDRISGPMSSYRQREVGQFQQFHKALEACILANNKGRSRYYVLDETGQEYYDGSWIE